MKFDKIMIIDADVDFLEEIKNTLVAEGCEVVALTSGANAVGRALSDKPDVILIELSSGPSGGVSVAERIGSTAGISKIPVVYLTGYYSVLHEYPEIKICFKRHFNPGKVIDELKKLLG